MKKRFDFLLSAIFIVGMSLSISAQKKTGYGKICGDPTASCKTASDFQPYELAFETPRNPVIYDSELFYAVILSSVKTKNESDCATVYSEDERINIQRTFPNNKVFALKCFETGGIYYTNVANNTVFMGIFAGRTQAEANNFLKRVKAAGGFAGATLKRMRAGINGT